MTSSIMNHNIQTPELRKAHLYHQQERCLKLLARKCIHLLSPKTVQSTCPQFMGPFSRRWFRAIHNLRLFRLVICTFIRVLEYNPLPTDLSINNTQESFSSRLSLCKKMTKYGSELTRFF